MKHLMTARLLLWLSVFITCAMLNGCAGLSVVPDEEVEQMGLQAFADHKAKRPLEDDRLINQSVHCVADAIIDEVGGEWELVVFRDDDANAFALPGRKLGVHTGLLEIAENPDQLAAVIGHEIGHVLLKHSNQRLSQGIIAKELLKFGDIGLAVAGIGGRGFIMRGASLVAELGFLKPFSRSHESEADELGLELMARAGFDPRASVRLWENMQRKTGPSPPEWLSTHPSPESRVRNLQPLIDRVWPVYETALEQGKPPRCQLS